MECAAAGAGADELDGPPHDEDEHGADEGAGDEGRDEYGDEGEMADFEVKGDGGVGCGEEDGGAEENPGGGGVVEDGDGAVLLFDVEVPGPAEVEGDAGDEHEEDPDAEEGDEEEPGLCAEGEGGR